MAVCSARVAIVVNQETYGVTAVSMAAAAGPDHGKLVNWVITQLYPHAVAPNSVASASQAPAAASTGPDPGPA